MAWIRAAVGRTNVAQTRKEVGSPPLVRAYAIRIGNDQDDWFLVHSVVVQGQVALNAHPPFVPACM